MLSRNWSISASVCEWIGVTCGSRRHLRVTALNVSYMGLSATIPPQLGNLSFLVSIDIRGNNFHGELPNELSHLRRLRFLYFGMNNLGGEIPSWIGSLHKLKELSLRNNSFTGSIPTSISNLSNLELLSLSFNSLQGSIPTGIGSLHNLKTVAIEYNQISGSVPYQLFNISTLETIDLSDNSLSGSLSMFMCNRIRKVKWLNLKHNTLHGKIPSGLSQCSELQVLDLSFNTFDGFIPKEIGSMKVLEELYLGFNILEGGIPREIGNLTMLTMLYFFYNKLTGEIPMELGNLYHLEELSLANNSFSGYIPAKIFNLSNILAIDLSFNKLSGNLPSNICQGLPNLAQLYLEVNNLNASLPKTISNCSMLRVIALSHNKFVGPIPSPLGNLELLEWLDIGDNYLTGYSSSSSLELGFITDLTNCKNLKLLAVAHNPLNGNLPDSVGNLSTSLERFHAYNCNIKGEIPEGFGNLSSLIALVLFGNQFTGSFPATIKDLQRLQVLDLKNNGLSRAMLDALCGLQHLEALLLSHNQISKSIPECLGNVNSLRYLYLDSNRLNSIIPTKLFNLRDLLELDLSSNLLTGSLPSEVGNLKVATVLNLSFNNLSNGIPNSIGGLQNLITLSLAFNSFQGPITESMSQMISLERLDLSHNNLSGLIPKSFQKLQSLKYLNVSFNNLSGEIPNEGPFVNFTSGSFMSNGALCGPQRFLVPPCPTVSRHKPRSRRVHLIMVFVCVGIFAILGFLSFGLVYMRCKKKIASSSGDTLSLFEGHKRVSYYELQQGTDGYNEGNLIGRGGFGSVYRGTLKDGRIVAIKVFNLQLEGAFKSFDAECEVLRNLRHRNLAKVISSCSTPDFKALVLEFMPNGSLDKWLYSENYSLDMKQRLNIMINVATALQYLHSGYAIPVVHCDLKPSNVLLDQEMVAHVSDFGIAKMLGQEDSFTRTVTVATLGYVAPEYGLEGIVSTKCDVYSYGIMLMEVFTRIRPSDERFNGDFSLKDLVQNSMPNALHHVVDADLLQKGEECFSKELECISSIMEIALACTRATSKERSNTEEVVIALNKVKTKLL